MSKTVIDLIRHGQPQGGHLYRGHKINDPLSEEGWQQMWQAVGDYNQWQQIISSPLLRCTEFATQLSQKNNIPLQIEDDFKEIGFGSWEGLSREQVKKNNLFEYNNFYADPVNNRPANSENLNTFIQRVIASYLRLVEQFKNKNILIIAHAGVIRAILAHIIKTPPQGIYNFKINNAVIARIHVNLEKKSNEIIFINHSF